MLTTVRFLRWRDVDPSARAFEPAAARAIAEALILRAPDRDRERIAASLERAIVAAYGAWAAGWCWAASEPGGGGPVRGWCCERDSLFRKDEPDGQASLERVVAALSEWRAFLVELGALFETLHRETADLSIEQGIERAAARLLPLVVERTGTTDAWYATFMRVVSWYLESSGHDASSSRVVRGVVSGRFASWCAPDPETARRVCTDIALEVAVAAETTGHPPDALAAWRIVRERAFRRPPMVRLREPVRADAHERYVAEVDGARDPARADRMRAALAACRASAARGEALTLDRMLDWQAIVLGEDASIRGTDAYAKAGRERYGHDADLRQRFERAIAQANETETSLSVRAARAFLDTCFYHPFADGNARAARLALDHVLTREGLALHAVEPLFVVARDATDDDGAWCMTLVLEQLVGPRSTG